MELVKEYLENQKEKPKERKRPRIAGFPVYEQGTMSPSGVITVHETGPPVGGSGLTDTHYYVGEQVTEFREDFRVTSQLEKANDLAIKKFETARACFAANAIATVLGNIFVGFFGAPADIGLSGIALIVILQACLITSFFYMKKMKARKDKAHSSLTAELDRIISEASNAQAVVMESNERVEVLRPPVTPGVSIRSLPTTTVRR